MRGAVGAIGCAVLLAACAAAPTPATLQPQPGDSTTMAPGPSESAVLPTIPTSTPTSVPPTQPSDPLGIELVFPDLADGTNGEFPQVAVGPDGAIHVSYSGFTESGGVYPVRYGECADDCGEAAGWRFVTVADHGAYGGFVRLALDTEGRPRLAWQSADTFDGDYDLHYAECDAGCTAVASWRGGDLGKLPNSGSFSDHATSRALAVDGSGDVHFAAYVLLDGRLLYGRCHAGCTNANGWTFGLIEGAAPPLGVAVSRDGAIHVVYNQAPAIVYRTCASECSQPAGWSAPLALYYMSQAALDLAVDSAGHPRFAFNQGTPGVSDAAANDRTTFYAWCDAGCTAASGWLSTNVGLSPGDGVEGVSLALDSAGLPVIAATLQEPSGLGLSGCLADCATASSRWQPVRLDSDGQVASEFKAPLPQCGAPAAFWYPGRQSFLAIDPTRRRFAVLHRTHTLESCNGQLITRPLDVSGEYEGEGVSLIRYAGGVLP